MSSESSGSRIMRSLANGKGAVTLQASTLVTLLGGVWMLSKMVSGLDALEVRWEARLDAIEESIEKLQEQAGTHTEEERAEAHEAALDVHEERLGVHDQRLDDHEERLDASTRKRRR